MKDYISLEIAHRLFGEAKAFELGGVVLLDSELCKIAVKVFGHSYRTHINSVCCYIFYVLACELMDVPPS